MGRDYRKVEIYRAKKKKVFIVQPNASFLCILFLTSLVVISLNIQVLNFVFLSVIL